MNAATSSELSVAVPAAMKSTTGVTSRSRMTSETSKFARKVCSTTGNGSLRVGSDSACDSKVLEGPEVIAQAVFLCARQRIGAQKLPRFERFEQATTFLPRPLGQGSKGPRRAGQGVTHGVFGQQKWGKNHGSETSPHEPYCKPTSFAAKNPPRFLLGRLDALERKRDTRIFTHWIQLDPGRKSARDE